MSGISSSKVLSPWVIPGLAMAKKDGGIPTPTYEGKKGMSKFKFNIKVPHPAHMDGLRKVIEAQDPIHANYYDEIRADFEADHALVLDALVDAGIPFRSYTWSKDKNGWLNAVEHAWHPGMDSYATRNICRGRTGDPEPALTRGQFLGMCLDLTDLNPDTADWEKAVLMLVGHFGTGEFGDDPANWL